MEKLERRIRCPVTSALRKKELGPESQPSGLDEMKELTLGWGS